MRPVGVFDSGIGGLSVWRQIRTALPAVPTFYVADQAHIPYGPLPAETVLDYSRHIVGHLEAQGCETLVVACNTASAVALQTLREEKPHLQLIGMEPAIKPAVEVTRSGVVVVLATPNTLEGALFQETTRRHAQGVRVLPQPCPGLVEQVERGETGSDATRELLRVLLEQPLLAGADTVVLGCTHYAFVRPLLEEMLPEGTRIIDPAPAIARRLVDLSQGDSHDIATQNSTTNGGNRQHVLATTGDVADFDRVVSQLLEQPTQSVRLNWRDGFGLTP